MTAVLRDNAAAYRVAVRADNPNLYFRFQERAGNFTDEENAQTGTANGGITYGVASNLGMNDTAVTLDGATGFLSVPDGVYTDLGDVLTLECWVKRGLIGTAQDIFTKGTNGYRFGISSSNNVFIIKAGAGAVIVNSTITITDTTAWHHIACTKNGATVHMYIDGVDVTGAVTNATLADTASLLNIGRNVVAANQYFNGSLDEVAIYPAALTAARVAAHYAAATQSFVPLTTTSLSMSTSAGTGAGVYPSSTLYPSSITYPGGWTLATASTNTLTLTAA